MGKLVIACVATFAVGAATSWVITERRVSKLREEIDVLRAVEEIDIRSVRKETEMFSYDFAQVRGRLETLETVYERHVEKPRPQAPRPAPKAAAPPQANWWCYFGRECFRSQADCVKADPDRLSECKPQNRANCGGLDGKSCFVDFRDCLDNYMRLATFVGTTPTFGPNVRECIEVE